MSPCRSCGRSARRFSRSAADSHRRAITALVDRLLGEALESGELHVVDRFAVPVVSHAIALTMGVPADTDRLVSWGLHVFRDPVRLSTSRWMVTGMAIWWTLIAIRFVAIGWAEVPLDLLVPVVATGVLVGFAEETLFRGIVLRGLREGGRPEATAATLTGVSFGLLHLTNVFIGTGVVGLTQIPIAAMSGMILYAFRRRFGSMLPAMVAHGVWDISTFLTANYAASWHEPFTIGGLVLTFAAGLTIFVTVLRHDRSTVALPPAR